MAVQIVGSTFSTAVWGIPTGSPELGFNCKSFTVTVRPEIREKIPGLDNQGRGLVVGDPMGELAMDGETLDITTASSIFLATFVAAFVPVNVTSYFGRSAGGWYLTEGEIKRDRGALREVSVKLESLFNLA